MVAPCTDVVLRAEPRVPAFVTLDEGGQTTQTLAHQIDQTRQFRAASRVRIPIAADVYNRRVIDLPQAVQLEPGRMTIEFCGTEQLLTYLFELAQAAANDFDRFRHVLERYGSGH